MGSQESRDTGNLRIGEPKRVTKADWRYTQEQVVETFGVGFSKLKIGSCRIAQPELYMMENSKSLTSAFGHSIT